MHEYKLAPTALPQLPKAPTGIEGLDEITEGGVPKGRPTLVCGSAGCGKTLFGIEFLVRGALEFDEPGVLMTFEETGDDIKKNVASLGFDIDQLIAEKKLVDLNCASVDSAVAMIEGSARSMGLEVVG